MGLRRKRYLFRTQIGIALHRAFTSDGGHAKPIHPGAFGNEGYALYFANGGSAIWGPYLGSRKANR